MTEPLPHLIKRRRTKYDRTKNIYCPLLKEAVFFNNQGFYHATHDGHNHIRGEADARMRLNLLPIASNVIKKSSKLARAPKIISRSDPANKFDKELVYYELYCKLGAKKEVIVVLRRLGHGRLHYYSVRYALKQNKP